MFQNEILTLSCLSLLDPGKKQCTAQLCLFENSFDGFEDLIAKYNSRYTCF